MEPNNHASKQAIAPELCDEIFNRDERFAARFVGVSPETLRTWRRKNVGPRYRKVLGKLVKYSVASLREFLDAQPAGGGEAA